MPLEGDGGSATAEAQTEGQTLRQARRQQERDAWDAFWKFEELETRGSVLPRWRYLWSRYLFDKPVTWFREKVAEPLQDKYKRPYYHRKISRVPEIDQCASTDFACIYEANEQFRLDKNVDSAILAILRNRCNRCVELHEATAMSRCAKMLDEYEENELNYFIKYGELGGSADVRDAYMKQKHRMIWERRHPHIMEERERLFKEHKEEMGKGIYNYRFWNMGAHIPGANERAAPYQYYNDTVEALLPSAISKDPQFYKKAHQAGEVAPENPEKGIYTGGGQPNPLVPTQRTELPEYYKQFEEEAKKTNVFRTFNK